MAMSIRSWVGNKFFKLSNMLGVEPLVMQLYLQRKYSASPSIVASNSRYVNQPLPDGLPAPPPKLVYFVTSVWDIEYYYKSGIEGARCIQKTLGKNNLDISQFKAILDFGCGCGRVIRQWKDLTDSRLFGTDYNAKLIEWCSKSLRFAEFSTNKLDEKLNYEDNKFDFIYAISVFSHMDMQLQDFWIRELGRVLRPNGYIYLTVLGSSRIPGLGLTEKQRQQFQSGELIVINQKYCGTNHCGAVHPEQYVRNHLCKDFQIIDFIPDGATDAKQDVYLIKKAAGNYQA
jgi:2-polyprenyl-3-methyl-5-hydroxy-6-metoxy-1,4-benzoquinol methylase